MFAPAPPHSCSLSTFPFTCSHLPHLLHFQPSHLSLPPVHLFLMGIAFPITYLFHTFLPPVHQHLFLFHLCLLLHLLSFIFSTIPCSCLTFPPFAFFHLLLLHFLNHTSHMSLAFHLHRLPLASSFSQPATRISLTFHLLHLPFI